MNNDDKLKKISKYADPYDINSNDDFETMSMNNDYFNNKDLAIQKPTAKVSPLSVINMYNSSGDMTDDKFTTAHKLFESKHVNGYEGSEDYFDLDPTNDNFPVVPKPRNIHNNPGASSNFNNSAMQYERPWDLSCIQNNIEERLQGLMKSSPQMSSSSHLDTYHMESPVSTFSPPTPSIIQQNDQRSQDGYDKPWDLRPEHKDERGQEGYEKPWDMKPHNKDERPSCEYDVPWDKNARKIERDFRNLQRESVKMGHAENRKCSNVHKRCNSNVDRERRDQIKSTSHIQSPVENKNCANNFNYNNDFVNKNHHQHHHSKENIMNRSCIPSYENVNLFNKNYSPSSENIDNLNKSHNYDNIKSKSSINSPNSGQNPNLMIPPRRKPPNDDELLESNIDNQQQIDFSRSNKNHVTRIENNNNMSVSMMAVSPKLMDMRSNEEYDEPWDQKIKNMMAQANRNKEKVGGQQPSVVPAPRNRVRRVASKRAPFDVKANLESQTWYHGLISRTQAEDILRPHKEGSYLIRTSESNHADYSLSVKSTKGFMHMRIVCRKEDGQYILGQFSQPFLTIPQMVYHYTVNKLPIKGAEHISLIYPVAQELL